MIYFQNLIFSPPKPPNGGAKDCKFEVVLVELNIIDYSPLLSPKLIIRQLLSYFYTIGILIFD
jgi:hypothetical protein